MSRKIIFLSLFLLMAFSLSASCQAAELAATEGVSVTKTWVIEFSHNLDTSTINENTVYITDSSNKKVPLETPDTNVEQQIALSPLKDYAYGETYTIHISKDICSANGKFLTEDVIKIFTTINSVADGMIEISEGGNIEQKSDELTLDSERLDPNTLAPAPEDFEYTIRYVARALPIEIDGTTVQANDITIAGDRAFVAYNTAGEIFNGGIQLIDISDEETPSILHEIKLQEMDINAVYYDADNNELVFGGGANPGVYGFRSFISKCNADNPSEDEIQSNLTSLSSYHLTSITKYNGHYFVAVGAADGGILELNEYFGLVNSRDETDIRDIEVYSDGILALAGTTDGNTDYTGESAPGKLIRSLDNPGTDIEICDFASSGHKATLDIYDEQPAILDDEDALVFMALSQEGLKILAMGGQEYNNQIVYELSNPEGEYTETNSVSYDGGLAFVANGGYGFRVLRLNGLSIIDEQTGELGLTDDFASIIGYHELSGSIYNGQSYSANHIEYKQRIINSGGQVLGKNILFVASGDSGVNIYTLTNPNTYEMIEIPDDMMDTIEELIINNDIEEGDPLVNNDYILIPLENSQITITFVFEEAANKNQLGYFTFSGNKEDINDLSQIELNDILFENVSAQGSGGSLLPGYSKLIGTFEPGQNIGFYLKQNGYENPDPTIFYSLSALNSDNKKHYGMYIDEDYQKIVMSYEDLTNLGDHDYDDGIFIIHIEPSLDAIDTTGILTAEELEEPADPQEPEDPVEDSSLVELQSNIEQLVEALTEENVFQDASWSYARSGESGSAGSWSIKLEEFLECDPETGEQTPGTNRFGFVNPVPAPDPLYAGKAIINWTNMNIYEEYWNPAVFITNHSLYAYDFPETDEHYQRLKGSMIFYKTDDADNTVYYYYIGAEGSKGPLNSFTLPAEE